MWCYLSRIVRIVYHLFCISWYRYINMYIRLICDFITYTLSDFIQFTMLKSNIMLIIYSPSCLYTVCAVVLFIYLFPTCTCKFRMPMECGCWAGDAWRETKSTRALIDRQVKLSTQSMRLLNSSFLFSVFEFNNTVCVWHCLLEL